ncbi:hypothetical protein [Cryobacterium sp. M91]|uniref:hypothetical protein n=1 Tax=Cryobacterium sp. M91 TaxID=2048294 RepID=UPI001E29F114|nr:hypothetical protein [Cryobacterium sp. M91]
MNLDVFGHFHGRDVVLEYDSLYYHRSELSGARDTEKTLALLEAGYLVARIREYGLQHLNIEHPNLIQIDHDYRYGPDAQLEADLAPGVAVIMSWCEVRAGATPRESDD